MLRSNVTVAVNLYLRNPGERAYKDKPFVHEVRGKQAIRELLALIDPTYERGPVRDIPESLLGVLTDKQRLELKGIRCPRCGRMDYGAVRGEDGEPQWGYLWSFGRQCRCRRGVHPFGELEAP
jgi:hypothetical protein